MSTAKQWLFSRRSRVIVAWALLLLGWELAFRVVGWKAWTFPAPSHVIESVRYLLKPGDGGVLDNQLLVAILTSMARLTAGFLLSVALGLVAGLLMWRYKFVDAMLGPVFLGLQTLPSVCWVPLAILTLGINESGILFVTVMGSFFAIAISLRDGLRITPPIYRAAGQVFGARGWNLYRYVMFPAALPALAGSLRSGFSFAWRSLMGGELILTAVSWHGLGHLLSAGRDFNDIAQVVAAMIVMVMIGMAVDRFAFAAVERRVRERFGLHA